MSGERERLLALIDWLEPAKELHTQLQQEGVDGVLANFDFSPDDLRLILAALRARAVGEERQG